MQKGAIFLSVWANPSKPGHQELLAPLPQAGKHPARVIGPVGGFNQLFWGCGSAPDYLDKPNTVHTERPELDRNPEPFSPFTSELGVINGTKIKQNIFINAKPNERGREPDYLHKWSQNTSWKRLKPNVFSSSHLLVPTTRLRPSGPQCTAAIGSS